MKKFLISSLAIFMVLGLLSGCANRTAGTIGGAAVGGLAGSAITGGSFVGTAVGAVGGGIVGNQLSK